MSKFLGYDMEPGLVPLVVGVVSTPEGLEKAADDVVWPCDVVEIRLDLIGEEACDWPVAALRLTKAGVGTLLTVRHVSEGGRWSGDEHERRDVYAQGVPLVSGIDVELSASILPDLVAMTRDKISLIGSYHQFRTMPESAELQAAVKDGVAAGVDVVKIAAYAADTFELNRLVTLLKKNEGVPLCAMAMGPLGLESRIALPLAGSCLTYGYLDKPSAPGQPSAEQVRDLLMEKHEEYRIFTDFRSQVEE